MELFWVCQGFAIVLSVAAIFAYCHFSKRNFFVFFWKHIKPIIFGILVLLLLFSYAAYYKLSNEVNLATEQTPAVAEKSPVAASASVPAPAAELPKLTPPPSPQPIAPTEQVTDFESATKLTDDHHAETHVAPE